MNSAKLNSELLQLIVSRCYKEGRFVLTSGRESSFYVDSKNATLHPAGAQLLGELATQVLDLKKYAALAGPTLGADPMLTAISLAAWQAGVELPALIIRKEPKKHGTSQWIEGRANVAQGTEVLLVEDVVTTGGSSLKAVEKLRDEGFVVRDVLALIDREEGGREALSQAGLRLVALVTIGEIREWARQNPVQNRHQNKETTK